MAKNIRSKIIIHTKYKWFWVWDFDEEEKWINQMSSEGKHLVAANWIKFQFKDGEPNKYIYRMQKIEGSPDKPSNKDYITFVEETGAEMVSSTAGWVYFKKEKDGKEFELFSDIDTKIKHLRKGSLLLLVTAIILILLGTANLYMYVMEFPMILNLIVGISVIAVGVVFMFGYAKTKTKIKSMKSLRQLQE